MPLLLLVGLLIALAVCWRCANNRWGWTKGQVRAHLNREPVDLDQLDRPRERPNTERE